MGIKLGLSIKQNSQNTATNKTNVTVKVLLTFDSGSWSGSGSQGYLTIDGTKYGFWGTFNTAQATSGTTTMFTKSVDIEHDSEGNKTLEVSAEYITTSWGTKTASASQVLTPIPRASAIAATDANIGAVSMIAVTRKGTGYTHSIAYKFGSLSGYITAAGGVSSSEVKLSETSVPFTLPDSFYAQIPNAKTGTCTLTIKTYSGSTQIGSAETTTFTVTAAESACKPTVSGTVVDSNSTTKALTGDASKLVRHKSTALCTISAAANKSATLSQKQIAGTVVTENTLEIEGVEESKVLFAATDSRGYTTTAEVAFELVPYVLLTNNPAGRRTDPTSGKATLTIKGNYYNGSFGSRSNTLTVRYRIGPQGGSYGSWVTVTTTKSGNTYSAEVSLTGLDYETTYVAEVEVTDSLDQVVKTAPIKKGMPVFDWGENDFAFHVPVVMNGHRVTGLGEPTADTDAATRGYVLNSTGFAKKRNISVTGNSTMAVGATFKLSESILKEKPAFAQLALAAAVGRVGGSTASIAFSNVTSATNGVYINYANFTVSADGLTLTLASTRRILLKADSVTVETDVSFNFGEVMLIY